MFINLSHDEIREIMDTIPEDMKESAVEGVFGKLKERKLTYLQALALAEHIRLSLLQDHVIRRELLSIE